jgi:hypothetical protein
LLNLHEGSDGKRVVWIKGEPRQDTSRALKSGSQTASEDGPAHCDKLTWTIRPTQRTTMRAMAMGKRNRDRQPTMWVTTAELPTAASHPFYRRLN